MHRVGGAFRLAAATIAIGLIASACGAASPLLPVSSAPAGLPSFYTVPSGVSNDGAGTLLKYQKIPAPGVDGTAFRIMYVSTNEQNQPVAVTGLVFEPHKAPPAGGYKIVDWAHGTNGMTNICAPSLDPSTAVPSINALLHHGWLVTASDYQGEGTPPGELAYLVGNLSGRDALDIVLAARSMPVHASSTFVIWGHSEGGQTAMFAWHLAATDTPNLHLVGTVAGAPPSQFAFIYDFLKNSPYRFYLFMAAAGFNEAYGNTRAPLDAVLTSKAISLLPDLRKGCFNYLERTLDHYSLQSLVKANPFDIPTWKSLLEANDPASLPANNVPLLIIQGGADQQVPVASTALLAKELCAKGQDLERWIYPGLSHTGVIPVSTPDMVHWMADRFAGKPSPDPYKPVGEAGVQTTTCP